MSQGGGGSPEAGQVQHHGEGAAGGDPGGGVHHGRLLRGRHHQHDQGRGSFESPCWTEGDGLHIG